MHIFKKMRDKYNSLSDVAKATFWFFACNVLTKCISLITTPIFTRLLPTAEYGYYNTFVSWTQIVTIIVTFRLDYGIFNKGMTKYPNEKNEYTATMQSISSILTFCLLLIYLPFQNFFNAITGLSTVLSLGLFAEVFFANAISFWMVKQRYNFKYKSVLAVSLSLTVGHTILGIVGVHLANYRGVGRILSSVLIYVCIGCIVYIYNYKAAEKKFVRDYAKFAVLFNIPLLPHYFASFILDQFDRIMIMKMVGYSAVGIYSVAYSCGYIVKIITSSLNNTLIPWLYHKLKDNDFSSVTACVNNISKSILLCFMGFMAFAPELIQIFSTSEYYEAIYVLPPISASAFLIFLYELYANIEFYYNKNKFTMYIAIASAIINIVLNYICIPQWGYIAAAYTTLIAYCFYCISHFIYVRKVTKAETCQSLFSVSAFCKVFIPILAYTLVITLSFNYPLIRYCWIGILLIYIIIRRKKLLSFISLLK